VQGHKVAVKDCKRSGTQEGNSHPREEGRTQLRRTIERKFKKPLASITKDAVLEGGILSSTRGKEAFISEGDAGQKKTEKTEGTTNLKPNYRVKSR